MTCVREFSQLSVCIVECFKMDCDVTAFRSTSRLVYSKTSEQQAPEEQSSSEERPTPAEQIVIPIIKKL